MMFAGAAPQAERAPSTEVEMPLALDLNFLPEQYQRRRLTLAGLLPVLLAFGFALLLIPLGRYAGDAARRLAAVEADLAQVQGELRAYQPLAVERAELEARRIAAQAASAEILLAYEAIDIQDVVWRPLLTRVLSVRPTGIELLRLDQDGPELTLEGLAVAHTLPSEYADALEGLRAFDQVVMQSVIQVDPEPDPGVSGTADGGLEDPAVTYQFEIRLYLPNVGPEGP